jgi:hypothetical protein
MDHGNLGEPQFLQKAREGGRIKGEPIGSIASKVGSRVKAGRWVRDPIQCHLRFKNQQVAAHAGHSFKSTQRIREVVEDPEK